MKLVMTLVVRNEADIIRANLDYHLANGVDFTIVTDHGSDDGTSEILREYERAGVVQVIRDERDGHHQSQRVTRMAQLARTEQRATWVIHNDADEFWWPQVGSLRDVFASLPERYAQIVVPRSNFRPLRGAPEPDGQPFYERLIYREAGERALAGQPKVAHRPLPGVVVAPGNHSLSPPDLPRVPQCGLLEIFHYPMRSYEQFERKVLQTGLGYERVHDLSPGVGCEQLELLAVLRSGGLREHYERLVLGEEVLEAGLREGTIALDRRLADFMRDVSPRRATHAARPDRPHAQQLLTHLATALEDVQRGRQTLERARAENRQLLGQLEALRGDVAKLDGRLEQVTRELTDASHALHMLRSSRLVRHTIPLRRLYYRLSGASARADRRRAG